MKTRFFKVTIAAFIMLVAAGSVQAAMLCDYLGAKYVFLFIGDGMSTAQIHGVEAYLAAEYQGNGKL
jgi:hypothetical protein